MTMKNNSFIDTLLECNNNGLHPQHIEIPKDVVSLKHEYAPRDLIFAPGLRGLTVYDAMIAVKRRLEEATSVAIGFTPIYLYNVEMPQYVAIGGKQYTVHGKANFVVYTVRNSFRIAVAQRWALVDDSKAHAIHQVIYQTQGIEIYDIPNISRPYELIRQNYWERSLNYARVLRAIDDNVDTPREGHMAKKAEDMFLAILRMNREL